MKFLLSEWKEERKEEREGGTKEKRKEFVDRDVIKVFSYRRSWEKLEIFLFLVL